MSDLALSGIFYGPSKVGKSTLLSTAPTPLLYADVELQTRFIPGNRGWVQWQPGTPCPAFTADDVVRMPVRAFSDLQQVRALLSRPGHGFRSVSVDSVTETQERNTDALAGAGQMKIQQWGETLRDMSTIVRGIRDVLSQPNNELQYAFFSAMEGDNGKGKSVPHVQGQLRTKLPYWLDVVGYYTAAVNTNQERVRRLNCMDSPYGQYTAGDRTGMLPEYIDNPTIPMIIEMIYGLVP